MVYTYNPRRVKSKRAHRSGRFHGLYEELGRPIGYDDYYTAALTAVDREMLNMAFQRRCRGDKALVRGGVRRVDFMGEGCCFAGIARSRDGTWELKTVQRIPPRMMLVSAF